MVHLFQRNEEVEKHNRELEHALVARDKVIADLRLRMPATADRDEIILRAQSKANTESERKTALHDRNFESEQSMKVAQSTISSLQVSTTLYHFSASVNISFSASVNISFSASVNISFFSFSQYLIF